VKEEEEEEEEVEEKEVNDELGADVSTESAQHDKDVVQDLHIEIEEIEESLPTLPPQGPSRRPPLPRGMSPVIPSSATTRHSRTLNELDVALKQFKASTAASRENLRMPGDRQDLRDMALRRPPLARLGSGTLPRTLHRQPSLRSRVPPPREDLESQWKQLSSSMSCLNKREEDQGTVVSCA